MSLNYSLSKTANNRNLVNQDIAVTPWIRNPLWMTMPDISASGTQRIVGLYRVDDSDNNFIAFGAQAQGTTPNGVTVDWGDGTVQSFVTNNTMTNIQYKYTYPVDGWYYFETDTDAYIFFNLTKPSEDNSQFF